MPNAAPTEQFVRQLTGVQTRLYAFILSLLPNADAASDVLQNTNVVMWRKSHEFVPGTNFAAWACRVAHFEVLAHRRDRLRDRLLFDDELLSELAQETMRRIGQVDDHSRALADCLERLPTHHRDLIRRRYSTDGSVKKMAAELGKSAGSLSAVLFRIRDGLLNCIQRKVRPEREV